MGILKYKVPLIIFLIYCTGFTIFIIISLPQAEGYLPDITPFVFGAGIIEPALTFLVYWPIMAIFGGVFIGYIITPLILLFHKKIIGKNMIYGIQERTHPKKFKKTFQGFFPSILAINLFLIVAFNQNLLELIFTKEFFIILPSIKARLTAYGIIIPIFTIGIAMSLFSPAWFLLDAGISCSNQKKVKGTEKPIEIKTIGGWYLNFLKGYTGIGVIISNFLLMIELYGWGWDPTTIIMNGLYILLLTISSIPAVILLDITKEHRIKYVRKWAKRFGITKKVEISFQEISNEPPINREN